MKIKRNTRLLIVRWDHSRTRIQPSTERYRQRQIEGIHWDNGTVMLKNCAVYANMNELEYTLRLGGKLELEYTHDIGEMDTLLQDGTALLRRCRDLLAHEESGTEVYAGDIKDIDEWMERAEKASRAQHGKESEESVDQLL